MTRPSTVRIREVGPRDGFQSEPEHISTVLGRTFTSHSLVAGQIDWHLQPA